MGRTHLAHKVEQAVDFQSGAVVAVDLAAGDAGDTKTVATTVAAAGEQIAAVAGESPGLNPQGPKEVVLDNGIVAWANLQTIFSSLSRKRPFLPRAARGYPQRLKAACPCWAPYGTRESLP